MNFGSEYTLHDSDDEEETVREDAPAAGPLSAMTPAVGMTVGAAPRPTPPPPPLQQQPPAPSGFYGTPTAAVLRAPPGLYPRPKFAPHIPDLDHPVVQSRPNDVESTQKLNRNAWAEDEFTSTSSLLANMVEQRRRLRGAQHLQPPPQPVLPAPPGYPLPNPADLPRPQHQASQPVDPASGRKPPEGIFQTSPFLMSSLWGGGFGAFRPAEAGSTAEPSARRVPTSFVSGLPVEKDGSREQGVKKDQAGSSLLSNVTLPPPMPMEKSGAPSETCERANTMQQRRIRSEPVSRPSRTWTRKVDTNILNIDMAALGDAAPFATGDPTICKGCRGCLSAVSILVPARAENGDVDTDGIYDWTCEFCGEANRAELDNMEKPEEGQDSVDYVVEAAPVATSTTVRGKEGASDKDESAVLFVVDTSGSMCVTTAVVGRLSLRGDRTKDLRRLLSAGDDHNQLMPGQHRGMTYVSRLQSMQAAIDAQLETMAESTPSRHAGLVTFNGEVTLIGDGSGDARVVAGDRLSDAEALEEVGRAYPLSRPVSEARDRLIDRLFALEEGGPTALGPAVVAGLSMLKERGGRGSRMVVCTDGMANVGLGALDGLKNDEEREAAENFYTELGRKSASNGVTVDVVSVDSDACDLENLGAMADVSGGTVTKVKASELSTNFAGILANPILASQVSVRVTLHKGLMFRSTEVGSGENTLVRDVGNVTRETELSFEYQVRSKAERRAMGLQDNGVVSSYAVRPVGTPGPPVPPPCTPSTSAAAATPSTTAATTPTAVSSASSSVGAVAGDAEQYRTPEVGPDVKTTDTGNTGGQGGENDEGAAVGGAAAAAAATPVAEATAPAFLPFQVQIRYTRPDGMKCMRVLTKTQRVTKSKATAEGTMHMAVVAGHAASQAGTMASRGAYHSTRVSMRAWSNLMHRNSTTERSRTQVRQYSRDMAALDSEILGAQSSEPRAGQEEDKGGKVDEAKESRNYGRNRKSARSSNDSLSYVAYQSKTIPGKRYS